MKKKKQFMQLAIVEYHNCGPWVVWFKSNRKMTIDDALVILTKRDGFDENKDMLTFVDKPRIVSVKL